MLPFALNRVKFGSEMHREFKSSGDEHNSAQAKGVRPVASAALVFANLVTNCGSSTSSVTQETGNVFGNLLDTILEDDEEFGGRRYSEALEEVFA
jgi:hypothetical protein